jgi:hypothetical protein
MTEKHPNVTDEGVGLVNATDIVRSTSHNDSSISAAVTESG